MPGRPARATRQPARQRLSADERRNQIFAAAMHVVAETGYANATLTAVAQRAGIAKGLLWHYFTDRDDLMQQTVHHLVAQVRASVTTGLDLSAPAAEIVRTVLVRTAVLTRTHAVTLEAIDQIVHSLRTPDGQQRITMHDYDAIYAEHEQLLARGQREGTVRDADVRVMAVSYQGVIDAMIGYLQIHPEADAQHHAAMVADVFLRGIALDH